MLRSLARFRYLNLSSSTDHLQDAVVNPKSDALASHHRVIPLFRFQSWVCGHMLFICPLPPHLWHSTFSIAGSFLVPPPPEPDMLVILLRLTSFFRRSSAMRAASALCAAFSALRSARALSPACLRSEAISALTPVGSSLSSSSSSLASEPEELSESDGSSPCCCFCADQ